MQLRRLVGQKLPEVLPFEPAEITRALRERRAELAFAACDRALGEADAQETKLTDPPLPTVT